jgi:RNA polymerase sigma factor (sigma-70 family)
MPDAHTEFRRLMEQLRGGCAEAAQQLYNRYSRLIRMVVRSRLNERLRGRFDSLDFVQDVWTSFFLPNLDRYDFDSPEALVAYLVRMTENKVIDEHRRHETETHNLNREVRATHAIEGRTGGEVTGPDDLSSPRDATPSQEASARECWELMKNGLNPRDRRILSLLLQGYSHRDIADMLGIDRKNISRLLDRLDSTRHPAR